MQIKFAVDTLYAFSDVLCSRWMAIRRTASTWRWSVSRCWLIVVVAQMSLLTNMTWGSLITPTSYPPR